MKIFDISQEVFSSSVYPEDRVPRMIAEKRISDGDSFNLTSLEMCTHNGTHIDAPFHFIESGDTAERIPLEKTVGPCYVCEENEAITKDAARRIINAAKSECKEADKRILIKGCGVITDEAAELFAECETWLLGVEGLSVGPEDAPMSVHKILLSSRVVLLEGLRLGAVEAGTYFLCAQPLSLKGSDGSPCRAILIKNENFKI